MPAVAARHDPRPSPPASATGKTPNGTDSLASVLAVDGSGFDRDGSDFAIVDNAVTTVLVAKPDSAVAVLADGSVAPTAFLPTDRAFRELARDLTGKTHKTEAQVFGALASAWASTGSRACCSTTSYRESR